MTPVGVTIIWEHPVQCLLKLDKKSLKFLFVGICQLKVLPVQLYASNLKCELLRSSHFLLHIFGVQIIYFKKIVCHQKVCFIRLAEQK